MKQLCGIIQCNPSHPQQSRQPLNGPGVRRNEKQHVLCSGGVAQIVASRRRKTHGINRNASPFLVIGDVGHPLPAPPSGRQYFFVVIFPLNAATAAYKASIVAREKEQHFKDVEKKARKQQKTSRRK